MEDSVFGVGPVSLNQEVIVLPRRGTKVKSKLVLDAVFSPAIIVDQDDENLAPVEVFELLSANDDTDKQKRAVAASGNMFSLADCGKGLVDKRVNAQPSSVIPSPSRKTRVLVWIRRDLFIARRFTAADCFLAREFERVPYAKSFSFT
jgi:hypothetical protein